MTKSNWTKDSIGDLTGKTAIVTGGASGIGFDAALVLAAKGAHVILAVRNIGKGQKALDSIIAQHPSAKVELMHIDLGDLESVKLFEETYALRGQGLDLLINNAGVMIPPLRHTLQGWELQFGTNHLAHFLLTGLLLPIITATPGSRIVTVSSIASRGAKIDFTNLDGKKGYSPMKFYRQSKYSNMLFGRKLDMLLKERGLETKSIICHPGVSATNLMSRGSGKQTGGFINWGFRLVGQPAEMGALPTLFAATHPDLKGGEYVGPEGRGNWRGNPAISKEIDSLYNDKLAEELWKKSEEITGFKY